MIPSFEQRHSAGGIACPMLGGGGGSSSSQANTSTNTTNTDKRLVVDGASIGVSADGGSSVTVNSLDGGAIQGAGQIALASIASNSTNIDHLFSVADHLFTQQQNALDANVNLTGKLAATAQTAYADATNAASGNKQLILAAMAVVGVVAFTSLKK